MIVEVQESLIFHLLSMAKFQLASFKNFLLPASRALWSRARSMKRVGHRRVQIWTSFASQFKMAMQLSCHCPMIAIGIEFPLSSEQALAANSPGGGFFAELRGRAAEAQRSALAKLGG